MEKDSINWTIGGSRVLRQAQLFSGTGLMHGGSELRPRAFCTQEVLRGAEPPPAEISEGDRVLACKSYRLLARRLGNQVGVLTLAPPQDG